MSNVQQQAREPTQSRSLPVRRHSPAVQHQVPEGEAGAGGQAHLGVAREQEGGAGEGRELLYRIVRVVRGLASIANGQ